MKVDTKDMTIEVGHGYTQFVDENFSELYDELHKSAVFADISGIEGVFRARSTSVVSKWISRSEEDSLEDNMEQYGFVQTIPADIKSANLGLVASYIGHFFDEPCVKHILYFDETKEFWLVISDTAFDTAIRLMDKHLSFDKERKEHYECIMIDEEQFAQGLPFQPDFSFERRG